MHVQMNHQLFLRINEFSFGMLLTLKQFTDLFTVD